MRHDMVSCSISEVASRKYREEHKAEPVHLGFTSTEHISELVSYDA
jgi:hypothetical protein